jgi:hypothetical protein
MNGISTLKKRPKGAGLPFFHVKIPQDDVLLEAESKSHHTLDLLAP